ncbi:TPA: YraN family protein [bacterium]|nr:YraN family protein [bacterium]
MTLQRKKMQRSKKQVGDKGEDIASDFLTKKGYEVIQRNYRCRFGEIDIIAEHDGTIIFVEVKTRHTASFGMPQEAITASKIRKISKTAVLYVQERALIDHACRFDVIAITYPKYSLEPNILHIENAFELSIGLTL